MDRRPINILITAGGTTEKIDSVRGITNTGTGKLGALTADAFAARLPDCRIVYICSKGAARPDHAGAVHPDYTDTACLTADNTADSSDPGLRLQIIIADDVNGVGEAIRGACEKISFDVIVHSMAISDYTVKAVSDSTMMARGILMPCDKTTKISSDKSDLVIVLEKAPKLISMLRGLASEAVIVGFKLLSNASEEELISAGRALLEKNDCDFVLANDLTTVTAGSHEGLLINREGGYERAVGKEVIAALIADRVLEQL